MGAYFGGLSAILRIFTLTFAVFVFFAAQSPSVLAQCGFNSIGDYTCAQPLGGGGGGTGTTTSGAGFNGADLLVNQILPNMPAGSCPSAAALQSVLSSLPQSIRNAVSPQVMTGLASGNCNNLDNLVANLQIIGNGISTIPDDPCGAGGGGNGDNFGDAIGAFIMNTLGASLSFNIGPISIDFGQQTSSACDCVSGSGGGTGGSGASCQTPITDRDALRDQVLADVEQGEGRCLCVYDDTGGCGATSDQGGNATIGVGHLITDGDPWTYGDCLTDAEVQTLFEQDVDERLDVTYQQMAQLGLNCEEFFIRLFNMVYQAGNSWNRTSWAGPAWQQMELGNYDEAADHLAGTYWATTQTPTRAAEFINALRDLDGGGGGGNTNCSSLGGSLFGNLFGGGGGGTPPDVDPLGIWCPDANARADATDASLPGTYRLSATSPADRIAESAMLSVGATTADDPNTFSQRSGPGGLGCALGVSRILACAGYPEVMSLATNDIYSVLMNHPCWDDIDYGTISAGELQPGDVLVTRTLGVPDGAGHTGIYVGEGNIISNGSGGYAGGDGPAGGTIQQNYDVDRWNARVVSRAPNPVDSVVLRRRDGC